MLILAKKKKKILNWKALNLQHIATATYTYLSLKNIGDIHWEESIPSDLHEVEQTGRYVRMSETCTPVVTEQIQMVLLAMDF